MQHVNDDMDDVFRKAAENYPLKTDNADWEKVQRKLSAVDVEASAGVQKNKRRYLLLLLLLIPVSWFGYNYFSTGNKKLTAENKADQPTNKTISTSKENISDKNKLLHNTQPQNETSTTVADQDAKRLSVSKTRTIVTLNNSVASTLENIDEVKNVTEKKSDVVVNDDKTVTPVLQLKGENKSDVIKDVPKIESADNNIKTSATGSSNEQPSKTESTKKNKTKNIQNKKQNSLYIGVVAAPDISFIKFQSVKSVGVNAGVILGYRFNKRLSVETGLFTDKKYYYTDGKYFNTGKIYLPANAKILNVFGDCRMLELPLNVRYNFKNISRSNWFAIAGLSSYFMKKENYNYDVVTTGQPYRHYSSYNSPSTAMFSIINAGLGYDRALGKVATLRIEPYLKIPLKGFGIGSLPIMSTGVNIGITKKLF